VTETAIIQAAKELAAIYAADTFTRVDPYEKERLYGLATRCPKIHYEALKINRERFSV
jgi:hypothetical protein